MKRLICTGAAMAALLLSGCRAEMIASANQDCAQMGFEGDALSNCTLVDFQQREQNLQTAIQNAANSYHSTTCYGGPYAVTCSGY